MKKFRYDFTSKGLNELQERISEETNKIQINRRIDGFFVMNASSVLSANVQKGDLKKGSRVVMISGFAVLVSVNFHAYKFGK